MNPVFVHLSLEYLSEMKPYAGHRPDTGLGQISKPARSNWA